MARIEQKEEKRQEDRKNQVEDEERELLTRTVSPRGL